MLKKDSNNINSTSDHLLEHLTNNAIDRNAFLKLTLKTSALVYLAMNVTGCNLSKKAPVALKKLSDQNYENITIMGNFFIKDMPVQNFNIGQALDEYLYGAKNPHPTEKAILELVSIPSSILGMLYINKSLITLTHMNDAEKEMTFLKWRNSHDPLQRGIYTLMHKLCMSLVSGNVDYQKYTGISI
ncbi:MAG: hypothetical protein OEV78_01960 [Spirochaetia bacterium]|nr:hypothetical protein [Spirochaetia bacterium]